jgi:hypothetical protein
MHKASIFVCVLLFLGMLAVIPAYAEPTWVSVGGPSSPEKPSADIINSDETSTTITFTTTGFWSENVVEGAVTFQRLSFPEYHTTMDVGKPEIPAIVGLVRIPGLTDVSVSVTGYTQETLTGYNVYPYQTALLETESPGPFDYDQGCYELDQLYPTVTTDITDPAIWRDIRIVKLIVYPIRNNPVTGDLIVFTDITIQLDYSGTNPINQLEITDNQISPRYDEMYNQAVLNYDESSLSPENKGSSSSALTTGYDYLIISRDDYIANLTPFVTWKTTQGLAVQVAPLSTVGSTVTAIKNYITQEYNVNGIQYVLLVGNESDIPGYTGYGSFSDYYYSLVAGGDNYPDLAIGRLCVHSAADVDLMVSKSVTFESNPPPGDWLNNVLLIANFEQAPGKYQGCKEEIRTASYSVQTPNFTTAYGASYANGGDEATNAMVKAWINSGQRVVNYRGHGDLAEWWYWNIWGESFYNSDVYDLANGQMTPVVFSIACWNGNIEWSSTCFAEAFTLHDYGASAILAASRPSYTIANHTYDKKLFKAVYDEGINSIGDASNVAAIEIINYHGSSGLANARMYLWFGDPALNVIYAPSEEPQIVSTSPTQNELNVSAGTNISVTFDMPMDETTINSSSFVVNATSTGLHQGTFASADSVTVTFYPTDDFDDGEVVTVVLTTDIQSEGGGYLGSSYIWSFTIATTNPSPATFLYDAGYAAGDFPFAVYAAMFDGDDDPDLAAPNWMTNNVSVFLNNGDATFPSATNYATDSTPDYIYCADFDADGNMDMVTADYWAGELSVLLGNGDGTFGSYTNYSPDTTTTGVVAADLNGDGIFDLAAPNHALDNVAVLFGNGDGSFGAPSNYGTDDGSNHIIAADLDNDADIDLITTNCAPHTVSILLNNGDGTFAAHVDYSVSSCPMGSYPADLDNDGDLDLVTANKDNSTVSVLINDGLGGFAAEVTYGVGSFPMHIFASDLDADGDLDLVSSNVLSDDVSILLNNGNGTFAAHSTYTAGDGPVHVYPSDLDGDGDLDLAVANEYVDSIAVLLNQPLTVPPAPILVSPLNYTIFVTFFQRKVTLDWDDVDYAINYEVLFDNDSGFSSPIANPSNLTASTWITPFIGAGKYYWKVRASNEVGWGAWSEIRTFRIILSEISCPILYSHTDEGFKYEDPLLTACANSGYVDVVTDYYHLTTPLVPRDGKFVFQLRELEDEITYLHGIELITVDHKADARISCDAGGQISLYQTSAGPLTAVDNQGNDQLTAVAQEDGVLFTTTEPGHLLVTFSNSDDGSSILLSSPKRPPCYEIEKVPDPYAKARPENDEPADLTIEILDSEGNWVEVSGSIPSREYPSQEIVLGDIADEITDDVITLRFSWQRGYSTDAIIRTVPSEETPAIKTWQVEVHDIRSDNPSTATWNDFANGGALILTKGDVFEFEFAPNDPSDPDLTRDYIIRSVGRYQPDYLVYAHLLPAENKLYTNYPNPFNPVTTINYDLPAASQVRLDVYNVAGQLVTTLVDEWKEAGRHQCIWNSKDADGRTVASGMYFYRLKAGDFVSSRKMVLLK